MKYSSTGETLQEELRHIETSKEGSYDKRTEHLNEDGTAIFINRLVQEDSPYLLQHAHNPVNWFPWGAEAFEVAQRENKPIFLSIGYSTCHWCHVMEVESFDNVEVAKVLNEHFVSIKMDREQYPDIDEAYMTGVQLMSGHGGWPMSNFLLTDGQPFFAATYFPPPTFMKLLHQIVEAWNEKYSELETSANKIGEAIDRILSERKQAESLDEEIFQQVSQALFQREDRSLGGLAGAPKFPQEPLLLFMLDRATRQRSEKAMGFASRSLDAMARGGIYDQVAGGFHRYSVDEEWLVPHFEKMLYNQSQLSRAYLQAYRLTGNEFFKRICLQTIEYVLRDMQVSEGGFYSATDADSEGAEGVFFLWPVAELSDVLSATELELVSAVFGPTASGNFEGSNILNFTKPFATYEAEFGPGFQGQLDKILEKLYLIREQRIHPLRDDKLIVAWAAAMVTSIVQAGSYFENQDWIDAARRAIALIIEQNLEQSGQLKRIYLNGTSSIEGQLEDYVNLVEALIALYDVTAEHDYLNQAHELMNVCCEKFWDEKEQGFFLSPTSQIGPQLTRSRSASDGATISPVATALNCLISLRDRASRLDVAVEQFYSEKANQCMSVIIGDITDNAVSHTSMLRQYALLNAGTTELIQYADHGIAKLSARINSQLETPSEAGTKNIIILIELMEAWHLTAPGADSESEQFKPLRIFTPESEKHWTISSIEFPESTGLLTAENGESIPIYATKMEICVELKRSSLPDDELSYSAELNCEIQLCNEQNCLLPKILTVRL